MSDLSERCAFQLVRSSLVVMPVTVQVPLVPCLEPLCEEATDNCGCPIQGIVLCGGFVANVISLSVDPLLGDPTFEQVNPVHGLLGRHWVPQVLRHLELLSHQGALDSGKHHFHQTNLCAQGVQLLVQTGHELFPPITSDWAHVHTGAGLEASPVSSATCGQSDRHLTGSHRDMTFPTGGMFPRCLFSLVLRL